MKTSFNRLISTAIQASVIAFLATASACWAQPKTASNAGPTSFAELPWNVQQEQLGDLPARRLTHARELLDLFSIDASQLSAFADGVPLGVQDEETVERILFRLPRIPLHDLHRWKQPITDLDAIQAAPNKHRADTLLLRGRTSDIERVAIMPDVAGRLEFDHYYRVGVDLADASHHVVLCCRQIPAAWSNSGAIGEPIIAYGLFLKLTKGDASNATFAFATPHVGWLPSEPNPATGVTADLAFLASIGMDVSRFDDVRSLNRKPIAHADRECFYQLLATVGNADPAVFRSHATARFDLAPLLQQPREQHGRLMTVRGTARRAMKIRVDDKDIQQRFGIDHYYQIDVFVPLGDQVVRLGKQDGEESPTFTNNYPVTVCVLQLPPNLPEGTDIREQVSISAASFKLWAYHSQFVSAFDQKQLQISPMFIGVTPQVILYDSKPNPWTGLAVAGAFMAMLVFAWLALWRSSKNDSKFKRDVLSRRHELAPGDFLKKNDLENK